jgi:hypothetical protein
MYDKSIAYDYETRDYAMRLDGELVGFARNYHEAEIALDLLVYEMLSDGHFASATELDGGSDLDAIRDSLALVEDEQCGQDFAQPQPDDVPTDAPDCDLPFLADCLTVVTMALGRSYGAASVVSELQRIKARLEAAAECDAARV